MRRYCLRLAFHCLLAAGTAAAAPALLRWQTDVARPQPRDWEVFQGETVVLAPVMTEGGAGVDLSGSACAMWYQTNGMAGAWWSVPAATGTVAGEVRATWSPTNDCGAARYNYFVAAASPAGTMYRAHGRLVMRHAPGAAPSILAAPTTLSDAMQAWADARYDPLGTAQAVSNALASAMPAAIASWASSGTVHQAGFAEEAYQASVAIDAGTAAQLAPGVPDKLALDAATAHITDLTAHPDIRAAITSAPEWIGVTNLAASVTVTNVHERPIYLYATGTVSLAISGLRPTLPLYLIVRGPDSLTIPSAYYVGGATWQTNRANHFVCWTYGTNLLVNAVTTTED